MIRGYIKSYQLSTQQKKKKKQSLNNYQGIKLSHTMTLWKKEIEHMLRNVTIINLGVCLS